MIKTWFKGVAIAALTAAGAVAAQAADLPTRKEAPAPIFVPPPFTWTGFYIGLNAGGIFSSGSKNATLIAPDAALWLSNYFPGGLGSGKTGFIGGGQAGYNWQTGAFVLGVVTDFDGTSLSSSRNFSSAPFTGAGYLDGDTLNVNSKASLDWLGTTRAKLGFVVTPDNRLMVYATGGVAYGGGSSHFNVYDSVTNSYWSGSPSSTRVGWTVGGGRRIRLHQQLDGRRRISLRQLGQQVDHDGRKPRSRDLLSKRLCDSEVQLQRVDLPRYRELQVLSA